MINDDDLYVVIVDDTNDADDTGNSYKPGKKVKTEPETSYLEIENDWMERKYHLEKEKEDEVENILNVAQEHGEILHIEEDDDDEAFMLEYDTENDSILDDNAYKPVNIIFDGDRSGADSDEDKEALIIKDINWRRRNTDSFVQKLKTKFPRLRYNNEYMVKRLAKIMKETQQPDPPPDYVTCDGDKYRCKICYTVSSTEPIAQRHYQEKHGERYLFCYACGATFRSRTNLYKHEKFNCQSSDIALVLRARALFLGRMGRSRPFKLGQREEPRKRFPCTECSATFANKASLEPHLRMHRGERPFRCSHCPRAYTSYIAMKHHMNKHSSIQFICDYCGRVFKEKGKLVVHLASHAPIKRYGCKECPKRYSTKSDLTVHVSRDHRNLPLPFDCKICPMRFARMSTLKRHMKKNHGMVIITSRMFARQLPSMTEQEIVTQLQEAIIVLKNSDPSHSNVQKEHYES
ncbi:zinc finger protein 200-like [Aricia agestis]|uniref:zinc finger protein 200-like n=1 Tax=Aricia agestis TaxID=91739 RepID=UPI001C20B09D|nr:zinc finger protein 200-like [Aricia agestis]